MQEKTRDFSLIKSRILQYLQLKGITKYSFYKNTGVTNGVLSQTNGISEDNLMKFLSYYDDVNLDWLFTGEGEIFKTSSNKMMTFLMTFLMTNENSEKRHQTNNTNSQATLHLLPPKTKSLIRLPNRSRVKAA